MAWNIHADAKQRFSRGDVECFEIRIAECAIGHGVFRDGNKAKLLSNGRKNVYARLVRATLRRRIRGVEPRGDVEIPPAVETHPVTAATDAEVVNNASFARRPVVPQFISVDFSRSASPVVVV